MYNQLNSYCSPPYAVIDVRKNPIDMLTLKWEKKSEATVSDPTIFGPVAWTTYHMGSANLPAVLSPISIERIKSYINGIPEFVPCTNCSEHARAYIEQSKSVINSIKGGDDVFKFFVDFHNYVNKRLNKPLMSYADAYNMWKSGKNISVLRF